MDIYSDCQGAMRAISSKMVWKCPLKVIGLGKNNKDSLPGHSGIEENEKAIMLAKDRALSH